MHWVLCPLLPPRLRLGSLRYHLRTLRLALQSASCPIFLDCLRGSVLLPAYLRLLGARVHPSAYIDR